MKKWTIAPNSSSEITLPSIDVTSAAFIVWWSDPEKSRTRSSSFFQFNLAVKSEIKEKQQKSSFN